MFDVESTFTLISDFLISAYYTCTCITVMTFLLSLETNMYGTCSRQESMNSNSVEDTRKRA